MLTSVELRWDHLRRVFVSVSAPTKSVARWLGFATDGGSGYWRHCGHLAVSAPPVVSKPPGISAVWKLFHDMSCNRVLQGNGPLPSILAVLWGRMLLLAGAGRGTRTPTVSPPADFESAASTDSAIPARRSQLLSSKAAGWTILAEPMSL